MSTVTDLLNEAKQLPAGERELLATLLLDSLPSEHERPIALDSQDEAELERRLHSIRTGQAKGHDLESVMESIRVTLRGRPGHAADNS